VAQEPLHPLTATHHHVPGTYLDPWTFPWTHVCSPSRPTPPPSRTPTLSTSPVLTPR